MLEVSMSDLVSAYRKAKVDLYYSTNQRLIDLLQYEEDLLQNLSSLQERLNDPDEDWVLDAEFLGGFDLHPKVVRLGSNRQSYSQKSGLSDGPASGESLVETDPARRWKKIAEGADPTPVAEFRLMSRCSIDLHVLSSLWIMMVGEKLEGRLPASSMGSRLRRTGSGRFNLLAPGSFSPYIWPYRKWRDLGLASIRRALAAGQSVVALTADVRSFYHNLNPSFLRNPKFISGVLHTRLTPRERSVSRLFVRALDAWIAQVGGEMGWRSRGIPVGLPASAVVANLALAELDQIAAVEWKPLYYGRYVDDIMIVLEDDGAFDNSRQVWGWLADRSRGLLVLDPEMDEDTGQASVEFVSPYLGDSDIRFENAKNKVFRLGGPSGLDVLRSLEQTIHAQSSEWRSLPSLPEDAALIGSDIAVATDEDGGHAATLRDADQISARKSAFAMRVRDLEAYERDLDPESWSAHRQAFVRAACRQVVVLPKYFELASYVPRLLKLAIACEDYASAAVLLRGLAQVYAEARATCDFAVKEYQEERSEDVPLDDIWLQSLVRDVTEAIASGLVAMPDRKQLADAVRPIVSLAGDPETVSALRPRRLWDLHNRLYARDLAHVPFRATVLGPELRLHRGQRDEVELTEDPSTYFADDAISEGLDLLVSEINNERRALGARLIDVPGRALAGLVFATRPANIVELYLTLRDRTQPGLGVTLPAVMQKILKATRGVGVVPGLMPRSEPAEDGEMVTHVGGGLKGGRVQIGLAMLQSRPSHTLSAALGLPILDLPRYESLTQLLNGVLSTQGGIDYLLLPELALPPRWFVRFASKLQGRAINLISGIEYIPRPGGIVSNQVWAALSIGGLGFPACIVVRQDKQRPAPQEKLDLMNLRSLRLIPELAWQSPPVICHGEFRMGLLICSELTNIAYRSDLRGRVDALLVPEYNRDLHTFDALVNSAATDVHAFIAQSNDREYGDSRIRAPHRDEWKRDVVRVRGGVHDYVVAGEIDYWILREFQSVQATPGGSFKPLPDGFQIAHERERMPDKS